MVPGTVTAGLRTAATALAVALLVAWTPAEAPVADAAERGDLETVRSLLRNGADVNAPQVDGLTALHWAAIRNEPGMAEVLLYAGATVRARTRLGGYTALHLASREGNADVVAILLKAGADPDAFTGTGVTALHFAAEADAADVVAHLVAHGADLDAQDAFSSRTPLMFAAVRNSTNALQVLLEAGADAGRVTRVKDYEEIDEANRAEQEARTRVREAALEPQEDDEPEPGAEPAAEPAAEEPAAERQEKERAEQRETDPTAEPVEEKTVELPASPTEVTPEGKTPPGTPTQAEPEGSEGQGKAEVEEEEPEEALPDSTGMEPLSLAQQIGKQGGFAALHYAAREGNREAARRLLEAGADVNLVTAGDRSSPLLVAVINGNYDLARDLLEAGADPNLVSDDGAGPLFATLNIEWSLRTWYPQPQAFRQQETDYLQLMKLLLEAGADPNQRTAMHIWYASYNAGRMGVDFTGATPFWRAAYAADVTAMRLLVENGADPNLWTMKTPPRRRYRDPNLPQPEEEEKPKDYSGLEPVPVGGPAVHPLHAAAGVGFGTSRVAQQHRAVPDGQLPAIRYMIEELGIDPNLRDLDGFNALHHAASRGDNATILYLIHQGADVLAVSRKGHTTADMANSPEQRAQPLPQTIALLEKLGSRNSHQCQSCGGATRSR